MIWPIRRWVAGQTSDDFRITVLPQASGAAIARTPRITGAFHGAMPRTTPAGCRTASETTPGLSAGMISPRIWVVRPAASRSMLAAKWTLKPAQGAVAPISSIIGWVNSPARASSRSAALSRSARRSPGPVCDQAGNARAAASTTLATSASFAAAASLATAPVTGSRRAYVAPEAAGAAAPSMMKSTFIESSLLLRPPSAMPGDLLKPENGRIDRGLEAPVDRQIGAVDPARAVGAQEQDRGRNVRRRAGAANPGDVIVDPRIAEDLAKFLEDRRRHRPRAHGVDAQSAVLEQRLMGGPHCPQQQELLRQRIGLPVRNLMRREERAEIGESRRGQERLGAIEIGAPAIAGD